MSLDNFTDQELMDELLNRRAEKELGFADIQYCHDCERFTPWSGRGDPPDSYNPCSKGHKMQFHMLEPWDGPHDEHGFYRRICSDRTVRPAIPPANCGNCHKCYAEKLPRFGEQPTLLCPECGNKRCPKASDHQLACTGSNRPGQPGSVYQSTEK